MQALRPPRRVVARHEVRQGHGGRQRPDWGRARLAALRPPRRRGLAATAAAPTGSTSTSCTGPTRRRRSRRPWRRSTSWSARARSATSGARTSPAGRWPTPTGSPARRARRRSSPRRTSTPCSTGPRGRSRPGLQRDGIGLLPYFPLARGLLTGKYRRGEPAPRGQPTRSSNRAHWVADATSTASRRWRRSPTERDVALLDVAIGGLAAQPAVASVIAGATTPEQVARNARAARWQPTAGDVALLDDI